MRLAGRLSGGLALFRTPHSHVLFDIPMPLWVDLQAGWEQNPRAGFE